MRIIPLLWLFAYCRRNVSRSSPQLFPPRLSRRPPHRCHTLPFAPLKKFKTNFMPLFLLKLIIVCTHITFACAWVSILQGFRIVTHCLDT